MTLANSNFEGLSEADLVQQISAGVPEGVLLDYKRDIYGRADADVREFLKDVSSFANTSGGHLIIGIDESGGVPTQISPLNGDADQDLQRLESLARDGLEPRIAGLRMRSIRLAAGGYALVLRIPKSWNPPHRVAAKNTNRIYGRNSAGAYELSIEELRSVFTSSANTLDRVRAFRAERSARIDAGEAIVPLAQNRGRLVVHLVPLSAFGSLNRIDPSDAYKAQESLKPMDSMGFTPTVNFEGFANINRTTDGKAWSYTQVFRNGIIEAVKVRIVTELDGNILAIPTLSLDQYVFDRLPGYFSALQNLDVPTPIILMITLQGVRGARLGVGQDYLEEPSVIDRDVLELPECVVEQYGIDVDYQRASRPAFDALWNTGGFFRSKHFDSTGRWVPPRR